MTAGFSGLNEAGMSADGSIDSNMALEFGRRTMAGVDRLGGTSVFDDYRDFYRIGLF